MSHYKPYPAYRDSGVEWIGQVPEHWEVARIKRFSSLRTERCSDVPEGWRYIGLEDVESGTGQYRPTEGNSRQNDDSTVGIFRSGDVLYGKLRPYLRKAIVSDSDGVCSTEFLVMQPASIMAPWLQQLLLTTEVTQQIEAGCEGTKMPRADWEHVGSIHVPTPSPTEQAEIISALARETSRIDALITKKTRFIELLKKKRSALITHAVTKGLNPHVKMKDSGVEWIGKVPEAWEVKPLKVVVSCNDDSLPETAASATPIRYVDISAVSHDEGIGSTKAMLFGDAPSRARRKAKTGDVIISTVRTYLKAVTAVDDKHADCVYSTGFAVLRARNGQIEPSFLKWLALNELFIQSVESHSEGLSYPAINAPELVNLKVVVPSLSEQQAIASTLDHETARIDLLTAKTQHSIDLLKERRYALITAAVTGQIDLREPA